MKKNINIFISTVLFGLFSFSTFARDGSFSEQIPITGQTQYPVCVISIDLDGDGDNDILSASQHDHKISWFENTDGLGSFGLQQTISTEMFWAMSVYGDDLDGDGDNDVLSASYGDNKIAWYENLDGEGNFGAQQIISSEAYGARSVFSADLDGDGDKDVLSAAWEINEIAWYENIDGAGNFGLPQIINTDVGGAWSVYSTDIDGDGDYDVLSSSQFDRDISWYENLDGLGNFGPRHIIVEELNWVHSLHTDDIDDDGDQDVLAAVWNDDIIVWFANTDGDGTFGEQQLITMEANRPTCVYSADLDGDNDKDVLSASVVDNKIAWYENVDGLGSFGPQEIITLDAGSAESVFSADMDGDGDYDVLSSSTMDDKIAWYENTDGAGTFGFQQPVSTGINGALSVFCADLDGDGDNDIVTAARSDNEVVWQENLDGLGNFGFPQVITSDAEYAYSVFCIDLDGDDDIDVLSASRHDDKIAWYENLDGFGEFGPQQIITTEAFNAESVFSADLDGDGDNDVLSASNFDDKIAWYENLDGLGDFGPQLVITEDANAARSVFSVDLDGDGDNDVIAAYQKYVSWFENLDGLGDFGLPQLLTDMANGANSVFCKDLDGDWDYDVLVASYLDNKVSWFENINGLGDFGPRQVITNVAMDAHSVFSTDLDNDGDNDVVAASWGFEVAWHENLDGLGTFGPPRIMYDDYGLGYGVFCADLDGDGKSDVLTATPSTSSTAWYRNLLEESHLDLTITPQDDPAIIPYMGLLHFTAELVNESNENAVYDAWINIHFPVDYISEDSSLVRTGLEIAAGETLEWDLYLCAPQCALQGEYYFVGCIGEWPDNVYDSETFLFEILPPQGNTTMGRSSAWRLYGWDENNPADKDYFAFAPNDYNIDKVYPNPFNPQTTVTVSLPEISDLRISVFNLLGQEVKVLGQGRFEAGYHSFTFDGLGMASGIYFIQADIPGKMHQVHKVVLMK